MASVRRRSRFLVFSQVDRIEVCFHETGLLRVLIVRYAAQVHVAFPRSLRLNDTQKQGKSLFNSQKYRSTYYISTARHKLSSDNLFKMCVELRTMLEPDGPVDCKLMNPRHTRVSGFCVSLSVLTCPPLFRCRCNSVARVEAPVLSLGGHLTLSHLLAYRFKDSDF
jgi:hypothetical protein